MIISRTQHENSIEFLAPLLKLLKPQGKLVLTTVKVDETKENLKLAGFVKTDVQNNGNKIRIFI